MGPETLGEDIQPRDVRAPVRKRINRCTGEFLKPELILIGCTNGKSREEAVLNFNHSGLGPNYIIAKDGKSESFVEARPALERIFLPSFYLSTVYLFGCAWVLGPLIKSWGEKQDKALCAWWGNPACWRLVRPVYTLRRCWWAQWGASQPKIRFRISWVQDSPDLQPIQTLPGVRGLFLLGFG